MTTQQLGTVIGGVIGYFVGYPQLGLVVGGLLGAALTPGTKTEGPRLTDKAVTSSQYGGGITQLFGTRRVGGTVVDSTDKIEIPTTTEQGGKGGGSENTTYQYFVHMRVVLCETPSDGSNVVIRKLWKDGKLIYDGSSGIPIGSALASAESPYSFAVLYQGEETQLPDPIEEIYHGVGNVPAYRDVVSIRLNAVECPGGRVPQFSFEISNSATTVTDVATFCAAPASDPGFHAFIEPNGVWHYSYPTPDASGLYSLNVFYGGPGYMQPARVIPLPYANLYFLSSFTPVPCSGAPSATVLRSRSDADQQNCSIEAIDLTTGGIQTIYRYVKLTTDYVLMGSQFASCAFDQTLSRYVILGGNSAPASITPKVITQEGNLFDCVALVGAPGPIVSYGGVVYAVTVASGFFQLEARSALDGTVSFAPLVGPAIGAENIQRCALYASAQGLYFYASAGSSARIFKITGMTSGGAVGWSQTFAATVPSGFAFSSANFYASDTVCIVGPALLPAPTYTSISKGLDITEVPVAGIIADQCERAGLEPTEYDVSSVDATVWGYTLTNPASARANIQPLMTAFAIDATEEDGKIRFFNRSEITSLATIGYDELGAVEGDGEPGDPMPLTRAQEAELPRSVAVTYLDATFDYQQATEKAIRQITDSVNDQTFELPIALNGGGVAAAVAQQTMYDAWSERNKRSVKVSRKYSYLSAGDGFTPEYPRGSYQMRRITKITDTGALLEIECVDADPNIYTQTVVGSSYTGQTVEALPAPLNQVLLDIPILRDIDNNAGIYDAIDSYAGVPANGALWVGDDDTNLVARGTVTASAPIGFAETILSGWIHNLVDETNVFTVSLGDDVFANVTRDVLLAGGGEYWACGAPGRWEIGASASSVNLGSGRFRLSRHLRGLFGTEANTGNHLAGDTFVLLRPVGMLRPTMSVGDLGQSKSYRVIAKGRPLDSAPSTTYANTGEGLRPLSPVNARRAFVNRDIQVDRRSRLSMNNSTGSLPLGEAAESYQWRFFTTSGFSTLAATVTTTTSTITEAQQTAAGITPTSTAYVRVSQISDSVGAGHELQATV